MYILHSRLTTLISVTALVVPLFCVRKKNRKAQTKHGALVKGHHKNNKNPTKFKKMFRKTFLYIKP